MNKKFPRSSLIPYALRTSDAACNHKHHFKNVLREVIGYLELRAKDDRERFVWFSVGHLTEHCKRHKKRGGAQYNERSVQFALSYLRRKHFISKRLERKRGGVLIQRVKANSLLTVQVLANGLGRKAPVLCR